MRGLPSILCLFCNNLLIQELEYYTLFITGHSYTYKRILGTETLRFCPLLRNPLMEVTLYHY